MISFECCVGNIQPWKKNVINVYFLLGSDKIAHNLVFIPLWCTEFYCLVCNVLSNIYTQLHIIVHTQRDLNTNVCVYIYIHAWIRSMHFGIMENSVKRSVSCFLPQAHVHPHSFMNRSYLPDIFSVKPCLNATTVKNWEVLRGMQDCFLLFYHIYDIMGTYFERFWVLWSKLRGEITFFIY